MAEPSKYDYPRQPEDNQQEPNYPRQPSIDRETQQNYPNQSANDYARQPANDQQKTDSQRKPPDDNRKQNNYPRQPANNVQPPKKPPRQHIKTSDDAPTCSVERCATVFSYILVAIFFPISIFFCIITVREFNRAVIFRMGRLRKGGQGPGLVFILPCVDSYGLVDLRTRVEIIPSQEMLTKDAVTISVDAVLFYCVKSSTFAVIQISNVHDSTILIAQTTMRNLVGTKTLHELLTSREELSREVGEAVHHATARWGVRVERVEIKDIALPEVLQRSLSSEAEALREARAKVISAEGELDASRALKEASDVMSENQITLQLRHLQILTAISHERQLTIIYPFPVEMMTPFENSGRKKGGAVAPHLPAVLFNDNEAASTSSGKKSMLEEAFKFFRAAANAAPDNSTTSNKAAEKITRGTQYERSD
ncbi:band 7 protein AGAP004871 isoform X2 [Drosophila busckii]|uniref:band 7 protein AGAP004871 isoform X2 n=1 Tax=Drosophila busckii TaxID=30019 RepID=UPI00083E9D0A|nr:band 7 protein AGAP004871 isoform X2 [Drosophila busckii]